MEWRRPSEIFGKAVPYALFQDSIEPNDINQGSLPNCYFLSALSSLAEHPDRVRKLFVTQEVNKAGIYVLSLCINGEFQEVVVDDAIPFDPVEGKPAFSRCHGPELWVMLLEKAWAKVNGSYERTKYGLSSTAFVFLTGVPCVYYDHQYVETFWQQLIESDLHNHIIVASS